MTMLASACAERRPANDNVTSAHGVNRRSPHDRFNSPECNHRVVRPKPLRLALQLALMASFSAVVLVTLFGNSSLQEDVLLHDIDLPARLVELFGGPRHGLHALRQRVGAGMRALTCTALKPQGLPPAKLADLASRFALGGIDYIKDDHGL